MHASHSGRKNLFRCQLDKIEKAVLIGSASSSQVAETGARVIATARDLQMAPGLQSLLQKHGDVVQVVKLDVADVASIKVRAAMGTCICTCHSSSASVGSAFGLSGSGVGTVARKS